MENNERLALIRDISRFLFVSLCVILPTLVLIALRPWDGPEVEPGVIYIVFGHGVLGAFVSLQRRLKAFAPDDLRLLSESWFHAWLSPLVGGVLATVLYCLFISGLITGPLFPEFVSDKSTPEQITSLKDLYNTRAANSSEYAKLMFWSFVAGFSEKFVIDIVGHFEGQGMRHVEPPKEELPSRDKRP